MCIVARLIKNTQQQDQNDRRTLINDFVTLQYKLCARGAVVALLFGSRKLEQKQLRSTIKNQIVKRCSTKQTMIIQTPLPRCRCMVCLLLSHQVAPTTHCLQTREQRVFFFRRRNLSVVSDKQRPLPPHANSNSIWRLRRVCVTRAAWAQYSTRTSAVVLRVNASINNLAQPRA